MAAVTSFSWSDTVQIALNSCLPCINPKSPSSGHNGQAEYDSDDPQNQPYNPAINRIPRARPDELQGLLADPDDTDVDAERMSLHSNPGASRRKKKRRSKKKKDLNGTQRRITLFGYNLFGRAAPPPIHLTEDGEDALYAGSSSQTGRPRKVSTTSTSSSVSSPNQLLTAHSAGTFDSDAAPLDVDTINALSSPERAAAALEASAAAQAAVVASETERQREKEERRRKRRERKEMRRVAEALAAQQQQGQEEAFEGFQGSGEGMILPPSKTTSGYPRIPNTMYPSGAPSDSGSEGFGRFVTAGPPAVPPLPPTQRSNPTEHVDEDDDAADLDGGLYSRRAPRDGGVMGSDSRSRTSASTSDRGGNAQMFPDPRNVLKHLHSQSQSQSSRSHTRSQSLSQSSSSRMNSPSPYQTQFPSGSESSQMPAQLNASKVKSKKSSSSSRTTQSRSSQSPSIPSPVFPSFTGVPDQPQAQSQSQNQNQIVSPSTIEQGLGFFDLEDTAIPNKTSPSSKLEPDPNSHSNSKLVQSEFPSARIGGGGGFPMTGFGRGANFNSAAGAGAGGAGAGGGARRTRDFGAFLARRGDDGDEDGGDGDGL